MLADLARHPATAAHVSRKLARHFVADDPPASAVEALGLQPRLVLSEPANLKVTYPQDLLLAELLLKAGV